MGGLGMGGLGGVRQPSARLDPAGQLLAEDGCALLPAPAGPSPSPWTAGQWEEQVEEKGSAGLINHLFPLLCLFSLPFAPSCGAVFISSVFASDAGVMLGTAEMGLLWLYWAVSPRPCSRHCYGGGMGLVPPVPAMG